VESGTVRPLNQPGVNAKAGEYVLEIDGKPLTTSTDIYLSLENKAGNSQVKLGPTLMERAPRSDGTPVATSSTSLSGVGRGQPPLRSEGNPWTGGYVHVPDTETAGGCF